MNHLNASPITQTNEVAGQYTPREDESPQVNNEAAREVKNHFLAEDLQKIRRSNHSTHLDDHEDAMDDDEHDGVIKDLLYPGLEDTGNDYDFFEEDYDMAQSAVRASAASTQVPPSTFSGSTDNHAIHRRTGLNFLDDLDDQDNSYLASYQSSMGRPYSDLSSQKLRR